MTQEELKRLAKIAPDMMLKEGKGSAKGKFYSYQPAGFHSILPPYDGPHVPAIIGCIVSSLLAPWTAVPVGDEFILLKSESSVLFYYSQGEEIMLRADTFFLPDATRFASPLHAAEVLHQNTEKA